MRKLAKLLTAKASINGLALALICIIIAGILGPQNVSAFPQSGHAFYGAVTNQEGGPAPYDAENPTDPTQTTMIYARDVTRALNFDGDSFSSGEYYGMPVTADELGATRYGYTPQDFIFPAYDPGDPTIQGAQPGDQIEFYICPPGREIPGVLVTDELGDPILQTFEIGGLTNFDLSADIVPPDPEAVSPVDGAVDVARDAAVTVLFDEDVSLVDAPAFQIVGSRSGDLTAGDATLAADLRTVTLPHADFSDFGETVTVTILAGMVSDGVGNLNEPYSWTFETYPYLFVISGNADIAGVALRDGSATLLATTTTNGDYSFAVDNGWSGTVTPALAGYLFDPASRSYTNVTADQVNQDYTATLMTFTISGNAGISNAELQDSVGTLLATADAAGDYSFTVDYGWSGVVTPVLEGYVFDPAFIEYTDVTEDLADQDYTATVVVNYYYLPLIINN